MIFSAQEKVFLHYESLESTPKTIHIAEPTLEGTLTRRNFQLINDRVVGFYGTAPDGDSSIADKDQLTRIVTYNMTSGEIVDDGETPLSYEEASLCEEHTACLLTPDISLVVYSLESHRQLLTIPAVTSIAPLSGGKLAYLNDRSIYLLSGIGSDNMSARILFTSSRYQVSRIFASSTAAGEPKILFNAFFERGNQRNISHVFLLGLEPAESNIFMDDYLPFANIKVAGGSLSDMDYAGNTILATLELDSAQRVNDALVYNQAEFTKVSSMMLKRLGEVGFSEPGYNINFVVGY